LSANYRQFCARMDVMLRPPSLQSSDSLEF
jgi:hypothetical protein